MNIYRFILILSLLLPIKIYADTYPEVLFDNSVVAGNYAKSKINYEGNSWIENINKHLLVADSIYFTPGNSLSLKYISAKDGNWDVHINYNRLKYNYNIEDSDVLHLRLYIQSLNTSSNDLPKIYINLKNSHSQYLNIDKYISRIEHKKWIHIKIPVKDFKFNFQNNTVAGIGLQQNNSSKSQHHIFLDQIEFLPSKYSEIPLRSAAVLSDAVSYDKFNQLKWQLPLTPSIRYIKIYRSQDAKEFSPIAIKPIHMQTCLDLIPDMGAKYYYKITWVDYNYNESNFSNTIEVQSKPLDANKILDFIQMAHTNYFVETFDINSGMYMPIRNKNKVIVSTKETSNAVLALLVGAENKYINRQLALNRISKIVFFLLKAQNKHGIFPAFFDGRKGVPEYLKDQSVYDVKATASLIESLLIAREYFNEDNDSEKDLRNRITQLYQQINWQQLIDTKTTLLKSKLALLDNENSNDLLTGFEDAINTYLLAVGSPKFPIPTSNYFDAIYHKFEKQNISLQPLLDEEEYLSNLPHKQNFDIQVTTDTLVKKSILKHSFKYGTELAFGENHKNLLNTFKPFLTINPESINDSIINWQQTLDNYIQYTKRRDNELGFGVAKSSIWGFYSPRDTSENSIINPAISSSSIGINKTLGLSAILTLYQSYGNILLGEYGFRAWIDLRNDDVAEEYMAINQSTIAIMIENAKSGLIWKLYNKIPELKNSRDQLFNRTN